MRLGVDAEQLLRDVGVSRATLDDPDARLPGSQVGALWARAYQLSGDPVLSLHAAEACPLGAYKVIDYIGSSACTVGEAFRYATRYFKLINTAVRTTRFGSAAELCVRLRANKRPPVPSAAC